MKYPRLFIAALALWAASILVPGDSAAQTPTKPKQFADTDPAVAAGVMTATLHPYVLALQRKP